jgi:hypothetical protein
MRCIDPTTDARNCGGCGMACAAMHASASCTAGQCAQGKCDPGWGDCNKDPKDGCEANLHADPNNCTACGAACNIKNAYVGCADGCYATACLWGFDDCNNNMMDGCEASVLSDKNNCGGCGKLCNALPNATASCVTGTCQIGTCNLGFADCDGLAMNGCEVKTSTDALNCGACKNACPQGNICVQGGCTCPMCNIPGASAKCVNNMCVFDHCNPGFADCNNNTGDGCEVRTDSDSKNCGACNNVCPMNMMVCVNSMCSNVPVVPFFDSMPGLNSGSTARGAGSACGTYLQANQQHQLVAIAANMSLGQQTNCKFIIFSHPAHMLVFSTVPKVFPAGPKGWFQSDPFAPFTMVAGQAYDITATCDQSVTYYYDQTVDNVNGIQSFSQNPNWSNYDMPVFGGHAGVDCGIQLF